MKLTTSGKNNFLTPLWVGAATLITAAIAATSVYAVQPKPSFQFPSPNNQTPAIFHTATPESLETIVAETATPTVEPTATPYATATSEATVVPVDLSVTDVVPEYVRVDQETGNIIYRFNITGNDSRSSASSLPLSVSIDGKTLKASSSLTGFQTWSAQTGEISVAPGEHSIDALVDPSNFIVESNEGNNRYRKPFAVAEPPTYTQKEWEYFRELAFKSEGATTERPLRKWTEDADPIIYVAGNPTQEHLDRLDYVIEELRNETGLNVRTTKNEDEANITYHINVEDVKAVVPVTDEYLQINASFALPIIRDGEIRGGVAVVSAKNSITNNPLSEEFKLHTIGEELWQLVTGLFNDTHDYQGSIFYDDGNDKPLELLPIDRRVTNLMYQPSIKAGMTPDEVLQHIYIVPN